ncbi:MAG: broad specificity phosphatase PhoE [Planctomycetota bacterium]|jgi:broad specificity phosphatase PhoE
MQSWTRIYLVRHGRVADDWQGRIYGDLDVPLSPEGEAEGRQVASLFAGRALSGVISSGLERAEYTAQHIRRVAKNASDGGLLSRRDDPRLRELNRGEWAGKYASELERSDPVEWQAFAESKWTTAPPGGENLSSLAERVFAALDDHARLAQAAVAIVAHKWVLRVTICEALGLPLDRCATVDVPTSGLVAVDWPKERVKGAHLPELCGLGLRCLPAE